LGIGIDESTAIIVNPDDAFEVIGERSVIIYDFHQAKVKISPSKEISAHNAQLHILTQGDRFDLKKKVVLNN
jgi:cyanophycinase